jgi:cytochrome c
MVRGTITVLMLTLMVGAQAADPERGAKLYANTCAACHSLDYNGVGPSHRGVFGRRIGAAPGYEYSAALHAKSDTLWNEKTLDAWLANPEKFIPGQKMGYMVASAQDRADLIAYLKKNSSK